MKNNFEIITTINSLQIVPEEIKKLSKLGGTIFRLNGAFLDPDTIPDIINLLKKNLDRNGKILIDLPGFKIRFLYLPAEIKFKKNTQITLYKNFFNHDGFFEVLTPGTILRINDGTNELVCNEIVGNKLICTADSDGSIKKGKGLHIDNISFRNTEFSLTELDYDLIDVAIKNDVDYVGLSFVHDFDDIRNVQNLLSGSNVKCLPKVESKESIANLHNILLNSEMVIVDRGDLAGEVGLDKIWSSQRKILSMAKLYDTKVIMATQFFINMLKSPVPSIAEMDSLYDLLNVGIDGIQLSDETSIGNYSEQVLNVVSDSVKKVRKDKSQTTTKKGQVLWLMGPTASGKTTIAEKTVNEFMNGNLIFTHYDGDEIRNLMGSQLAFSDDDRLLVVKSLVYFANKSTENGINVIVSALTAGEKAREYIQKHVDNLNIIYIDCNIEECINRDPKQLYHRAINGEIDTVIGYNTPYYPPEDYALKINSGQYSIKESVDKISEYCVSNNFFS